MHYNRGKNMEYFFEKSFFDDFYIYNIGNEVCEKSHTYGPNIRENYILHFIVSGEGVFSINDTKYHLTAGDFFLVRPSAVVHYKADDQNPWTYYWIGFNGNKVQEVLDYLKINDNKYVGRIDGFSKVINKFKKIFSTNILADTNKIVIQQYLFEVLGSFQSEESEVNYKEEAKRRYSFSFITYIEHYYRNPNLKISDIAYSFGLNNSYFSQVIKSEMGMTPNEYLTYYRMSESGTMLMKSNKSVKEIAYSVGYENALTFSRAFKKIYGISPSGYRNEHLSQSNN